MLRENQRQILKIASIATSVDGPIATGAVSVTKCHPCRYFICIYWLWIWGDLSALSRDVYYSLIPALTKIIIANKQLVLIIVLFYLHSSVWFTNPVGTNLVMFNLYKKKHNVGKLTRYDHALLAIFEFRGVLFSFAYVGRKKNEMAAWWEV
jgi:hypothetical protein